jgi:hypothetical protein
MKLYRMNPLGPVRLSDAGLLIMLVDTANIRHRMSSDEVSQFFTSGFGVQRSKFDILSAPRFCVRKRPAGTGRKPVSG